MYKSRGLSMPSLSIHRSVTEAAIARLGAKLQEKFLNGLIEGLTDPDRVPDIGLKLWVTARGRIRARVGYAKHHSASRTFVDYYFNLSLYNLRRGDEHRAGVMLGRALHYVQDEAISRRKHFVLDMHDEEEKAVNMLAKIPQCVEEVCKAVDVGSRRTSSEAAEALCIAFRESVSLLARFTEESDKPVNTDEFKRRIRRIRRAKALVVFISALLTIVFPPLIAVALPIICATSQRGHSQSSTSGGCSQYAGFTPTGFRTKSPALIAS